MATWSPRELAALFQAWRESADSPFPERSKLTSEVFRRFSELVGDSSLRTEAALTFKQGSLRNMVQLLLAFGDRDKWFALSLEQKKRWFRMVNRMSYRFVDMDRETFDAIADLVESHPDFASSHPAPLGGASGSESGLRVRLRRNPIDGEWAAEPDPELLAFIESSSSSASQHASAPLPPPPPTRLQSKKPRPAKEFPFASARGDTRSIFAPASAGGARSIFAPPTAAAASTRSIFEPPVGGETSTHGRRPLLTSDTESSADSGSDSDGMREERRAVAAHLKQLERASPSAAAARARTLGAAQKAGEVSRQRVTAAPPTAPSVQCEKRPVSPPAAERQDGGERQLQATPELAKLASVLEAQARELKALLAAAKEERALDLRQREADASAKQARDAEIRLLTASIEAARGARAREEGEKQRLADELEQLRAERRALAQERTEEAQARRHVLEQIARDREERRAFEERRARDGAEREAYLALLAQDRAERERARAEQEQLAQQIRALVRAEGGLSPPKAAAGGQENAAPQVAGDADGASRAQWRRR